MKRFTAVLTALIIVLTMAVPVMADSDVQVVTFGDSSSSSSSSSSAPAASAADTSKPYLALGKDLTQAQLATVLNEMGLMGTDLSQYNVVYVSNAEEHQYLDKYISSSVIGTKSLSSVLVKPAESGHGINVTTHNINYCTTGMYKNALLTAGVQDADIVVAAPTQISGTAALIGALKAYADMTNTTVNEKALDTSLNELVTTGELEQSVSGNVSKEDVENLVAFIKAEIAGKDLNTRDEIDAAVRQAIVDYNAQNNTKVELSEDEINQIVDLMVKVKALGLDYNTMLDQASDLYSKFGNKLSSDNIPGIVGEAAKEQAKQVVGNIFTGIFSGVKNFFKGILNK